jgi:hypothetical protein
MKEHEEENRLHEEHMKKDASQKFLTEQRKKVEKEQRKKEYIEKRKRDQEEKA